MHNEQPLNRSLAELEAHMATIAMLPSAMYAPTMPRRPSKSSSTHSHRELAGLAALSPSEPLPSPKKAHPFRKDEKEFTWKFGQKHHVYSRKVAPYPMSYERSVIDLDVVDHLFHQYVKGGPSFVDFNSPHATLFQQRKSPRRCLDLGCGTGVWILDAAKAWPEAQFIGFDLVPIQPDLTKLVPPDLAWRIEWVRGNFLDGLPFDDGYFDYIHVRSIGRGVPEDLWDGLFEELNRVLRVGGAIEVIEEDIIFPTLPIPQTTETNKLPGAPLPVLPVQRQPPPSTSSIAPSRPSTSSSSMNDSRHTTSMTTVRPSTASSSSPPPSLFSTSTTTSITSLATSVGTVKVSPSDQLRQFGFVTGKAESPHDHSLLERLFYAVFERRFINLEPTNILPNLMNCHFKHLKCAPPISFPYPPLPTTPMPMTCSSRSSSSRHRKRRSASSARSESAAHSRSSSSSSLSLSNAHYDDSDDEIAEARPRSSSKLSPIKDEYEGSPTRFVTRHGEEIEAGEPEPTSPYYCTDLGYASSISIEDIPSELAILPSKLFELHGRALAIHLQRTWEGVLACKEAMWEELLRKLEHGEPDLLEEAWWKVGEEDRSARERFEILFRRYEEDMKARTALPDALGTGLSWRDPFRPSNTETHTTPSSDDSLADRSNERGEEGQSLEANAAGGRRKRRVISRRIRAIVAWKTENAFPTSPR